MALFADLKKKYTELLNPVKQSLNDNSGWVRGGQFVPGKQIQKIGNNLAYQARNTYYQTNQNAWSPGGTNYKAVNAIQNNIKGWADLPRKELYKQQREQIKNPILRTGANLAVGIPESIVNIPRNYMTGIARTGLELGTAKKEGRAVNVQNLLSGIAPLSESIFDVATMGGYGVAKNVVKNVGKQGAKVAFKQGAKTGAKYGGFGGLTYGLDNQYNKDFSVPEVLQSTAGGAILGGILGGTIAAGSSVYNKFFSKLTGNIKKIKPNLTEKQVKAEAQRYIQLEGGRMGGSRPKYKNADDVKFVGDLRESLGMSRSGDEIPQPGLSVRSLTKEEHLAQPIKTGEEVSPIKLKQEQILPGKSPILVKPVSSLKPPKIVRPAKVNTLTKQVLKANQLDSASERIIQQARTKIGVQIEPKKTFTQKFDEFYTNWVDRYHPLVKLTQGIKNIDPTKDPKYVIRKFLGAGSIAEQRFQTKMKPILKQIDDLKIDKTDLDVYLVNKRNVGFGEIGRKVYGSDSVKSKKIVAALEAKYGDSIKGITDKLYEFQNQGLDDMVKAGFIDSRAASEMRGQNPNYAPFQRVMDEVSDYIGLPTKKAMQGTQPIKKLKGSDRQILSPVESIIANIFSQRAAIEKNNVARSVAGLRDIIPGLNFKQVSKSGDSTITVWNNGKKEFIEVGNDIARAMKGMNEETATSFLKILTAPASLHRQGATGRNPEFMIPNVIRDQLDAAVNSKYGYKPFIDYVRGLAHIVKKDEVFNQWMESGGAQSFGSISGRKSISAMFDQTKAKKGLFSWLGSGLDLMGKYSEQPTRVGLFSKALKKGASQIEAAYESREGTMDFARMGAKMKVANAIVPFLNVGVQGFDKMIRNFRDAPAKTTLKMGIYGVAPAAIITLYNENYHPEEYAEIPQFVKDDNFVLVKGRNEKGTVDYLAIPKGNLIRLVTNPTEHFINYLAGNDKTTFGEMVTQLLSSNLPLLGEGSSLQEVAVKTIGQNIPQAIRPVTENLLNKSFYKYNTKEEQSKEIVPYFLQKKAPGDQAYEFTPAMYKVIGKVTNTSPLKVQNLMEGYLAGYTKIPANIIDSLKNISENKPVEQNKIPILRRFIQETYPTTETEPKIKVKSSSLINKANAYEESPEAPKDVIERINLAAKSVITNPANASNVVKAIFTQERMRKLSGDALILERQQYLNQTKNTDDAVDHIIPLSLGGDNSESNLRYISKEANAEKGKLETRLASDLRNGKITREEARNQIKNWVAKYEAGDKYIGKEYTYETESGKTQKITIEEVKKPELTGQTELDKLNISSYNSKITTEIKNIQKLAELGELTPVEAEKLILEYKAKKISTKKAKKPKAIKLPKIKVVKIKMPKFKKPKKIKIKKPKVTVYKRPVIKKITLKA